jgi:poly(3-hydroxybutyrate) depolymerase
MAISPLDKSISVDVAGAAARIDEVSEVEINGAQLHYRLSGPPEAPLIITLHGGRGFGK